MATSSVSNHHIRYIGDKLPPISVIYFFDLYIIDMQILQSIPI